jgi:colanic acid/amylovoran biosynthesis glycosyltransferase
MDASSRPDRPDPFHGRIAYLLSQYPAVSHTFFFSEIAALRERGIEIVTASINSAVPPGDGFSRAEKAECERTYYVKAEPKLTALWRLARLAIRHPAVVVRGLREVFRLASWSGYETLYGLFYLAEALLLGEWMGRENCSHLHVHFSGPVATVALLASVAWEIPFSMTVHGPDEFFDVEKFYLARKIEGAKFVVCISHFCRSQLLRLVPYSLWDKLHVCRLGVNEDIFQPAGHAPSGETQLVTVGRLHPSKGQPILLLALESLVKTGKQFHLHLIGGGAERDRLEAITAERGLAKMVTFYGAMSHAATRNLLCKADLFVLPSFAEGIPVALMEAMAMEIACISTFVAGIPELICPGEEGLLVAPSAVTELAAAINLLATDPIRRGTLAKAGRAKVLADYSLSRNVDRLVEIFRGYGIGADKPGPSDFSRSE